MRTRADQDGTLSIARSRIADYVALAKPELTLLSVLTATCGAFLAVGPLWPSSAILHTVIGTFLVGSGAGILNQFLEREYDSLMRRTAHRPLPAGRVRPLEAGGLGVLVAVAGVGELALFANLLAGSLALITLATYLFLYTPLKRLTALATAVGAIPGALPPVIGWVAVRGELSLESVALFAILFFWQMPHFLSLAWMYRADYARAGYRLLPVVDVNGERTAGYILGNTIALVVTSLIPFALGFMGLWYAALAVAFGTYFLLSSVTLLRTRSNAAARRMFVASLVYLPGLLLGMVIGKP